MSTVVEQIASDALAQAREDLATKRRIELAERTLTKIEAALQVEKDLAWIVRTMQKAIKKHEKSVCLYRWRTMPCDPCAYADALQRRFNELEQGFFKVNVVLANGGWRRGTAIDFAVEVYW